MVDVREVEQQTMLLCMTGAPFLLVHRIAYVWMRGLHMADDKVVRKRKFGDCDHIEYSALALNGWKRQKVDSIACCVRVVGNESEKEVMAMLMA